MKAQLESTVTEFETDVLRAIYNSEYQCGTKEETINYPVWSDCISHECKKAKGKSISGVVYSLVKKGLVDTDKKNTDGAVWLTQAGYNVINP